METVEGMGVPSAGVTEYPEPKVEIDPKLKPFEPYFNVPVAVQLHMALVAVDVQMDTRRNEDGSLTEFAPTYQGYGGPTLAFERAQEPPYAPTAKIRLEGVVFGQIAPSECGQRLVLIRRTDRGGMSATLLGPEMIAYLSVIVSVPAEDHIPAPSRIVRSN